MIRAGLAHGVLTPQTESDPANDEKLAPESHEILRQTLTSRGVRDDQIEVLSGRSISTWTDATSLLRFMREHPGVTIAITTDGFHTRRARWVFQRVLGREAQRVFFVSAPSDTVSSGNWWTTEEGLAMYLAEYSKFFAYMATDRQNLAMLMAIGFGITLMWVYIRWKPRVKSPQTSPSME